MTHEIGKPKPTFYDICEKVSFGAMVLFLLDVILLGTGGIAAALPVSPRIFWFALAGVASVPMLIRDFGKLRKNHYVIAVSAFLLWIAISAVRGFLAGNNRSILVQDVKGFLNYGLLPAMLCVLATQRRREAIMKVAIGACVFMAVATVVMSYFSFMPNREQVYLLFNNTGLASISCLKGNVHRIFFHSASRVFLLGYMFLIYFLVKETSKKKKAILTGLMGLMIVAIFISYTRAIYGGCFVAAVVAVVFLLCHKNSNWKTVAVHIVVSALIAVAILGVISLTQKENLIQASVQRLLLVTEYNPNVTVPSDPSAETSDPSAETSDPAPPSEPTADATEPGLDNLNEEIGNLNIREEKLRLLYHSIQKNPIFGNGLGAAIELDGGYVEYTYQDVVNKMGVIGLLLFLMPFLMQLGSLIFVKKAGLLAEQERVLRILSVGIMVYFLVIAYYNPCMNTTSGIFCYLLTMVLFTPAE